MTTVQYMAHADLPLPNFAKDIESFDEDKLLCFLNTYGERVSKFTIDGGNVGKPIVCAYIRDSSSIKAVMLNSNKQEVYNTISKQGYTCSPTPNSRVIQCVKEVRSSKL